MTASNSYQARITRLITLLCLLVLAWSVAASPASSLRFKHLGALGSDELSILSLMQDTQGFIWVGTHRGGLFRYNGYQALRFSNDATNPHSLPHDHVSTLFQDKEGRIWAGTQEGLARYNPASNDFTRYAPPPGPSAERIIKAIVSDGKDGLWLATWGGLQHFNPATGAFTLYKHDPDQPASLASNDLNALALDERGGLWAATWPGGLDYLPAGAKQFLHYRIDSAASPNAKLNIVRSLHFGRDRTLWIGTESGVVTWNTAQPWEQRQRVASPATRITHLYADRNDTVWAGTLAAGLLRWDSGSTVPAQYVHQANDSHSLPSDNIRAVVHDRSGMLWVGTFTDGISLVNLSSQGFQRFIPFDVEPDNLRPDNSLQAIDGAPGGRLWLSTNSGVSLFDPVNGKVLKSYRADPKRRGALSNDIAYSLYQQPGGPLWVGTAAGLNRLDHPDGPFSVIKFGKAGSDFINAIAPGSGATLWLGTGLQVIRYHPASGAVTNYFPDPNDSNSRSVASTTSIVEDRQGRVWMGSEWGGGGLDLLDPKSGAFRHFRHDPKRPDTLSGDNVSALYEDPQGRLWVGTAQGLSQVLTGPDGAISFRSFRGKDSVGQVKILAIRADQAGKLWMSTSTGLLRLDPASGQVSRFTPADGVTEGFNVDNAYAAPDGRLYFGGVKGITGVVPQDVRNLSVAPQVAITDIGVFNQSLRDGKPVDGVVLEGPVTRPTAISLAVPGSVLSIEFAALHYTDPERNTYAYRLDGFDRDWVTKDATHRSATYTNLDPGNYVFEVRAANHHGVWSDNATRLNVTILPPWWQTWWFRLLLGVLAFGLLAMAYRMRVSQLTRRQNELESLVAARTSELKDSNDMLATLSSTDGLTGITNRRGFDDTLASEWRRATRNGYPLALAMLDVDHFKSYNDHYGHQAGDQCLRTVAHMVATQARRTSDLAARYGGEEFALLAPATDAEQAMQIAQAVCIELARLALPHAGSPHGVVTISVGVAVMSPTDKDRAETLVRHADRALYRAKQEGRNRALLAHTA